MRNVIVAAFAALVTGAITVACGGSGDLCSDRNVRCESPLACDPQDGVCKCGGPGGVACAEGFACDADANTCLSNRCAGVSCGDVKLNGYDCDRLEGVCKCGGTGGVVCSEGNICNPATKTCQPASSCDDLACPQNMVCDPNTIACVCGNQSCNLNQACSIAPDQSKVCAEDLCSGVRCLGSTTCDAADGRCKCNGVACQAGELCGCPSADGGTCADSARICRTGSACGNVTCTGGTTCDPADGKCKCGGPGGPACGTQQVCSLQSFQCQGGNQCQTPDGGAVSCAAVSGTSCDPEDGLCKCGGRGGEVCVTGTDGGQGDETCVTKTFSQACKVKCDVRFQNCPAGQYCYWDTTAKTPTAYCSVNSDTKVAGQGCTTATDCFTTNPTNKGVHCNGLGTFDQPGSTGFCRTYCDSTVPAGTFNGGCPSFDAVNPTITLPPQKCTQIMGAPAGSGFCENA